MTCGEYVENMLIFAQYSTHIVSNQQLVTSIPFLSRPDGASCTDNDRWVYESDNNVLVIYCNFSVPITLCSLYKIYIQNMHHTSLT